MGEKLCWDRWKNIISGKIDSSAYVFKKSRKAPK